MDLLEAFILLGICRVLILTVKFKRIAPYLGILMKESSTEVLYKDLYVVENIAWAINNSSKFTFWESKCLVQAITAKVMLRRRKIKSTIYFGVFKDEDNKIKAHAWVRCGNMIVNGEKGKEKFTIVSVFGDA